MGVSLLAMDLQFELLAPDACALVLLDQQAGLAFAVQSQDRQALVNNTIALVKTALTFKVPIIVSTSASKVYSGPLMPAIQAVIPDVPSIERRNMNCWEDNAVRQAILATNRPKLLFSGLQTEACVTFPALSAMGDGLQAYVVADTCGGTTIQAHELALRRMERAGAQVTSWLQVLLEFQRDWTRKETYDGARGVIEENGGGYGVGLQYARQMIAPASVPMR